MSGMKPCPFCGKEDLYFEQDEEGETNIVCDWCEYKTRIFQTIGDAARWWNTRPIEDTLKKRIAELEEAQRWIPVSERMPEDGEHVLAAYVDTMLTAAYYRHHIAFGGVDNWWDIGEGWHTGNPTHWMPLSEPPEVQE